MINVSNQLNYNDKQYWSLDQTILLFEHSKIYTNTQYSWPSSIQLQFTTVSLLIAMHTSLLLSYILDDLHLCDIGIHSYSTAIISVFVTVSFFLHQFLLNTHNCVLY